MPSRTINISEWDSAPLHAAKVDDHKIVGLTEGQDFALNADRSVRHRAALSFVL